MWTSETQVMAKRKVGNQLDFLACRWRVTYHWKDLDKGYNFALDLIPIRDLHTKWGGPKVVGVPTLVISWNKKPFGCGFVERHKSYYKGEGGGFPQVRAMVSHVSLSLLMVCPSTKTTFVRH
jgi:hypothetical protein